MKKALLWSMIVAVVLVLAACGSKKDENASTGGSGVQETGTAASEQIEIRAKNYQFDQTEYKIKKGVPTKLTLTNESGIHSVKIPDQNIELKGGDSEVVTFDAAGTYEISCNIPCGPGHTEMKAKIVVE